MLCAEVRSWPSLNNAAVGAHMQLLHSARLHRLHSASLRRLPSAANTQAWTIQWSSPAKWCSVPDTQRRGGAQEAQLGVPVIATIVAQRQQLVAAKGALLLLSFDRQSAISQPVIPEHCRAGPIGLQPEAVL